MSTKHLRRILEAQEREKAAQAAAEGGESSEEEEVAPSKPRVNRFALLNDSDSPKSEDESEEPVIPVSSKAEKKRNKGKKKPKKKKNDAAGGVSVENELEMDEDKLLEKLAKQNLESGSADIAEETLEIAQLFKVDPRLLDPSEELKRVLGRTFKENSTNQESSKHRNMRRAGRLVKQQNTWPPHRSIGLSMVPDHDDGPVKWFKFVHNSNYEGLERMCWLAEDTMNHTIIQEILHDNYTHLNALLMIGNMLNMQEDVTQANDCISRGIFYAEQSFHPLFQPTSWNHRLDYCEYENRAFYLLLHRHMLNIVNKRCFQTAFSFAKLIFSMDPQRDSLGILLLIDTIALKAKQYRWIADFYRTAKEWKNLDLLPNIVYSLALAKFLTSDTDADRDTADELLSKAITSFPGVINQLLDELQVAADSVVESHRHVNAFAYNKEPEGLKAVVKIYVKQSAELWKVPTTLSWLETVTRTTLKDEECNRRMDEWAEKRQRLFVGEAPSVKRLSVLLGLDSSGHLTDPVPPVNGRARYTRAPASQQMANDSMLASFIHSIYPDYNPEERLTDFIARHWENMPELRWQDMLFGRVDPGDAQALNVQLENENAQFAVDDEDDDDFIHRQDEQH